MVLYSRDISTQVQCTYHHKSSLSVVLMVLVRWTMACLMVGIMVKHWYRFGGNILNISNAKQSYNLLVYKELHTSVRAAAAAAQRQLGRWYVMRDSRGSYFDWWLECPQLQADLCTVTHPAATWGDQNS